jgi:hypothetical protein
LSEPAPDKFELFLSCYLVFLLRRAAQLLDEELTAWRQRPLSEVPYLVLDARYENLGARQE